MEPGQNFLVKLRYLDAWATSSDLQDLHLDIRWTEEEPTLSSMTAFYGVFGNIQIGLQEDKNDIPGQPEFRIPAGATGHVETFEATFPDWFPVLRVWGIGGSMGPLGVEMEVQVVHAPPRACEQTAQCLLHIGSYDPRWPMIYEYDYAGEELVEIRGGDTPRSAAPTTTRSTTRTSSTSWRRPAWTSSRM